MQERGYSSQVSTLPSSMARNNCNFSLNLSKEQCIILGGEAETKSLKVVVAVEEQYLTTDILQAGVMERPVLPPNLETIRSAAAHF